MNTLITPEIREQIAETIENEIRPYVESDGGRITLKHIEGNTVFVELGGACSGCASSALTLRVGIDRILRRKFKEIKAVRLWDDSPDTLLNCQHP